MAGGSADQPSSRRLQGTREAGSLSDGDSAWLTSEGVTPSSLVTACGMANVAPSDLVRFGRMTGGRDHRDWLRAYTEMGPAAGWDPELAALAVLAGWSATELADGLTSGTVDHAALRTLAGLSTPEEAEPSVPSWVQYRQRRWRRKRPPSVFPAS